MPAIVMKRDVACKLDRAGNLHDTEHVHASFPLKYADKVFSQHLYPRLSRLELRSRLVGPWNCIEHYWNTVRVRPFKSKHQYRDG